MKSNSLTKRYILWSLVASLSVGLAVDLSAQIHSVTKDPMTILKRGKELYDQRVYYASQEHMQQFIAITNTDENRYRKSIQEAEYYQALASIKTHNLDGIVLAENFSRNYPSESLSAKMNLYIGDHYFAQKNYDKAIQFYAKGNLNALAEQEKQQVLFKSGYAYFVSKKFSTATNIFEQVSTNSENYTSAQYYLAMCQYFKGDFDKAIEGFKIASKDRNYQGLTPSYISQMYFAQKNYDLLISFAESKLDEPGLKKRTEIRQLLGQSYFIKKQYEKALPHLVHYEQNTKKLTEKQFYQLAYTQYINGRFADAITNFEQVANQDNELAQNASYYLADCYLKNGNDQAAIAAFKRTHELGFDKAIAEESFFIMAKLSMKTGQDRQAIELFNQIKKDSKYYAEAQMILGQLLLETKDYTKSLEVLETLKPWTAKLQNIHDEIKMMRAIQQFGNDDFEAAAADLKSIAEDSKQTPDANYWLGIMANNDGQYENSQFYLNEYLAKAKKSRFSNPEEAAYINIYNNLKLDRPDKALKSVDYYLKMKPSDNAKKRDATIRAGDILFQKNDKKAAFKYYKQANTSDTDIYPIYQMAMIRGLEGDYYDKIVLLDDAIRKNPKSEYADDALWNLGTSYMALGKNPEALRAFEVLIKKYKSTTSYRNEAILRLGLLHYNAGDYLTALEHYKSIFDYNPNAEQQEEARKVIEEIYIEELADSDGYFAFLDKEPDLKNTNFNQDSILYRTAEIQYQTQKFAAAASSYFRYIDRNEASPNTLSAYYYLGESHVQLEQYDQAFNAYQKVIEFGPSDHYLDAIEKAAVISYNHSQNFVDAFNYYTLMEEEQVDDQKKYIAQVGGFRSAQKLDNTEAKLIFADKVINSALAKRPEKEVAKFQKARIIYERNDLAAAKPLFMELGRSKTSEIAAESKYRLAEIYFRNGEMALAENQANRAYKESSDYPYWVARSILILGDIALSREDIFGAEAAIDAIIENYQDDDEILEEAQLKLELIKTLKSNKDRVKDEPSNNQLEMDDSNE